MALGVSLDLNQSVIDSDILVPIVEAMVEAGVEQAKRYVPVDTGNLQSHIEAQGGVEHDGDSVVGHYGVTDVEYAAAVEFGTSRMAAQPYLRPSIDAAVAAGEGNL